METLLKYHLLDHLVDSNGIVDESVLDKLKFNVRSMLSTDAGRDKALLDLCLDVIYHSNMKAFGLGNLISLFKEWEQRQEEATADSEADPAQ